MQTPNMNMPNSIIVATNEILLNTSEILPVR
jgi:hypothetical protein